MTQEVKGTSAELATVERYVSLVFPEGATARGGYICYALQDKRQWQQEEQNPSWWATKYIDLVRFGKQEPGQTKPQQIAEALTKRISRFVKSHDVYISPILHKTGDYFRNNAKSSWCLWVDIDNGYVPDELMPYVDLVKSGTANHRHGYIRLTEAIPPAKTEYLNYLLMQAVRGDKKWNASALLRLPGSLNFKTRSAGIVEFAEDEPKSATHPDKIAELLLSIVPSDHVVDYSDFEKEREQRLNLQQVDYDTEELHPFVQSVLEEESENGRKSDQKIRLVRASIECGYTDDLIYSLALSHTPSVEKHRGRLKENVRRELDRYRPDHEHVGKCCICAKCENEPKWPNKACVCGQSEIVPTPIASSKNEPEPTNSTSRKKREVRSVEERLAQWEAALDDFTTMKNKELKFLHEGFLLANSLSIVVGDGGVGKGNYCAYLAASLAKGTLPGNLAGTGHKVLYISTEDTYESVVLPRLLAHDLSKTELARIFPMHRYKAAPKFPEDIEVLDLFVKKHKFELIVLDKFTDFMGHSTAGHPLSANSDQDVSDYLTPLLNLAEKNSISIVGLRHTKKSTEHGLNGQALGSVEWRNVPRSGVFLMDHRDGTRTIDVLKTNIFKQGNTYQYELETVEHVTNPATNEVFRGLRRSNGEYEGYSKFMLGEQTDQTADETYASSTRTAKDKKFDEPQEDKAYRYLLKTLLRDEEIPTKDRQAHKQRADVGMNSFENASKRLVDEGIMKKPGRGVRDGSWELIDKDEAERKLSIIETSSKNELLNFRDSV